MTFGGFRRGLILSVCLLASVALAQEEIVKLPLTSLPAVDVGPNKLPVEAVGKPALAEGSDSGTQALSLPGTDAHLKIANAPALDVGTGEFTISLRLHTAQELSDDPGDLVSKYDVQTRKGFLLGLRCNTGITSCQSNWRQLQFGINADRPITWRDEGRPGEAILAFSLCVHEGTLYAGTCEPAAGRGARVYRYDGSGKWVDLGVLDGSNSVSAMATWHGKLYAATAKYRLRGSALEESPNTTLGGRVYRRDGDKWTECGQLPQTEAVGGLVVYQDRLYASSLYLPAGFFRYEDDGRWTSLPVPNGKRVEAMTIFNGRLYATSYDGGRVYQFDGKEWTDLGQLGDNTQTYSFATYAGHLHVGTWPSGKVFRLGPKDAWEDVGRLGQELEVMGLCVHNGQLIGGTLPLAEAYRYDGGTTWTRLAQLDATETKYRRVWCMAQYQGRLFCSTLPSGHVHSMETGACVTHDHELSPGWHHVAAVRHKNALELFVDGKAVAKTTVQGEAYDLSTDVPLRIGSGPVDAFNGRLSDVRIHRRALTPEEIARLAK